jgi:membrane dipeptidase
MASILIRIEREADGQVRICRDVEDIRHCIETGTLAAVLHIEGAEAIDPEFETLDVLHQAGLRSLGPVWSRPNAFGHGVPFRCPSSPDTGPGLTDLGKDLVRACNRLKILIDLSHLNERGFWDAAEISSAPLVVTHTDAHAICPSTRNITDEQIRAVAQSGGVIGLNFETVHTREDGRPGAETPLAQLVKHVDHIVQRHGVDFVAFGSDFDGADDMPGDLSDVSKLPNLIQALRDAGYDQQSIEKIAYRNWLRVLKATWKE